MYSRNNSMQRIRLLVLLLRISLSFLSSIHASADGITYLFLPSSLLL